MMAILIIYRKKQQGPYLDIARPKETSYPLPHSSITDAADKQRHHATLTLLLACASYLQQSAPAPAYPFLIYLSYLLHLTEATRPFLPEKLLSTESTLRKDSPCPLSPYLARYQSFIVRLHW